MSREKSEKKIVAETLNKILAENNWSQARLARQLTAHDPEQKAFTRWNERVGRMLVEKAKINMNDIVTIYKAVDVDLRPEYVGDAIETLGYQETIAEAVHAFLADDSGQLRETKKRKKKEN